MPLNLVNFDTQARAAVGHFWNTRKQSRVKNQQGSRADQGNRGAVTSGKNMDGFVDLITEVVRNNGLPNATFGEKRFLTLPGYYRVTKKWDLVVLQNGELIAAVELKSIADSFGNNFNNRTEEALGSATDFWTAFREDAFVSGNRPFVGWLILVADCPATRKPIRVTDGYFPSAPEFRGASYCERAAVLCRRMAQERLYTQSSIIFSPEDSQEYSDFGDVTSLRSFIAGLAGHVAAEAARLGI